MRVNMDNAHTKNLSCTCVPDGACKTGKASRTCVATASSAGSIVAVPEEGRWQWMLVIDCLPA